MINNNDFLSIDELIDTVVDYSIENKINKISIFAKNIDNVLKLHEKLIGTDIELLVVSFPTNQVFYFKNEDDEIEESYPEILDEENRSLLREKNIKLLSSTLPLEAIIIPGERSNPYNVISETLNLFGEGLDMVVQASMMLTDHGVIEPNEQIVSMNARLALDLNSCNTRFLFHPDFGLKINQVIK